MGKTYIFPPPAKHDFTTSPSRLFWGRVSISEPNFPFQNSTHRLDSSALEQSPLGSNLAGGYFQSKLFFDALR